MRNVICVLLFIVLCSNECDAPYKAKMECRNGRDDCNFKFHNSLEFSIKDANVSWWKGSIDIGIYYRARNTSGSARDSMDYGRFSLVDSKGNRFYQTRRENGPTGRTFAPGTSLDSIFVFASSQKYSRAQGMEILKTERFFLVYSDGAADTLLSLAGSDSRIR